MGVHPLLPTRRWQSSISALARKPRNTPGREVKITGKVHARIAQLACPTPGLYEAFGITLIRPGMTMQINNVEKGSPAEATGKLQKGQIIESINGKVLKEIDPRIILGDIVTEAEAKDGKVVLKIQGAGDVTVNIPVMGGYSKTWPVNCPKSDKIVRNLADFIVKQDRPKWGWSFSSSPPVKKRIWRS